jgi:hypothetical protein
MGRYRVAPRERKSGYGAPVMGGSPQPAGDRNAGYERPPRAPRRVVLIALVPHYHDARAVRHDPGPNRCTTPARHRRHRTRIRRRQTRLNCRAIRRTLLAAAGFIVPADFAGIPSRDREISTANPRSRAMRRASWSGVALCQSLDLEHHLAAHHEADRLDREASEREPALPIRRVVVSAPGEESATTIAAGVDDQLPG